MSASRSNDAFTIERHGELVLVTATPLLETLDEGLEEQAAELIMGPIRDQDGVLVIFDLGPVDYFGSMFLALLIRCWKLALARGGTMALAGVSEPCSVRGVPGRDLAAVDLRPARGEHRHPDTDLRAGDPGAARHAVRRGVGLCRSSGHDRGRRRG